MDSIPQLRDVARDLGLWGVASNLPAVLAPIFGGWILAHLGPTLASYRLMFFVAAGSFALGSLIVLAIGRRPIAPWWTVILRFVVMLILTTYTSIYFRVRGWGRLPFTRGATLAVMSPQHEIDDMVIVLRLWHGGPWRDAIFTASTRRQFEPGFLASRVPQVQRFLRRYNPAGVMSGLGMLPIENELSSRALRSWAWAVSDVHGDLPLHIVFNEKIVTEIGLQDGRLSNVFDAEHFDLARRSVKLSAIREPYRSQLIERTRTQLAGDLARLDDVLQRGGTLYLAPEGRRTTDGRTNRFRATLDRLAPLAEAIYVLPISFDPLWGRRLSILCRVVLVTPGADVEDALKAARPITISQLFADWLVGRSGEFSPEEAIEAIDRRLVQLPAGLFVDPLLSKRRERVVRAAIATMLHHRMLQPSGEGRLIVGKRTHPEFPDVADVFAYQAHFFAETLEAAARAAQRDDDAGSTSLSAELVLHDARL